MQNDNDVASRARSAGVERSLGDYLTRLRDTTDELRTVSRRIDPANFEVTALLEHLDQGSEYPAVHFRNPLNLYKESSQFSVVANLFATRARLAEMLGLTSRDIGPRLGLHYGSLVADYREPTVVDRADAPVQEHVYQGKDADLRMFPIVRHSEMDLGPVLTMAHVMKGVDGDFYNVTFAKTFPEEGPDGVFNRGGITIHTPHLSRLLREWELQGERIPIVNILGHHPAFWLGSLAVTPFGNNEYGTIGGFMGAPLRLAPSVTWGSDFLVPADAEIIIEGEMVPGERTIVNPFGEISRQYQAQELAPVMEVKAITHRTGAIMQDIFSGHREHMLLGSVPREGSVHRHLQERAGNITAVHLPYSGCGRFVCYISIKKVEEGQPKQVALQALAQVPAFQTVIVVDDDIDVFNEEDVLWAVHVYADPDRDIDLIRNLKEPTDHRAMKGNRLLIDATRPTHTAFPTRLRVPPDALAAMNIEEWLDDVQQKGV